MWRLYMTTMPLTSGCLYLLLGKGLIWLCRVGLGLEIGVLPATAVVVVVAFSLMWLWFRCMVKYAVTDDNIPSLTGDEGQL